MTQAEDRTLPPVTRVRQGFKAHYGAEPAVVVQAPGRVNLIGEHTDYNEGFVLPCAIDYCNAIALSPRPDTRVRVVALDKGAATDSFDLDGALASSASPDWPDYVRGTYEILRRKGHPVGGADIAVAGNVPQGAGLSSSASLLVGLIAAQQFGSGVNRLARKDIAVLARAVETDFVGVQCGIMDQMISACGEQGHALMIDCRSLDLTPVALAPELGILIIHSGVERGLVGSAYNDRRAQCAAAAEALGVPALRDADLAMVETLKGRVSDVVWRRAKHIVGENARVLEAREVLAQGDTVGIRRLLQQSHSSMRDDFEITTPKVDDLVAIVQEAIGDAGGARMTGGGFGGCIVAVANSEALQRGMDAAKARYRTPRGEAPLCFVCTPSAGVAQVFGDA